MFERYTEKARRVIFYARYEASQYGSGFIESEHLLLGLLREDRGIALRIMRGWGSLERIRAEIEKGTTPGKPIATSVDLPLTVECKRILDFAKEEADRLGHHNVATGHLLLGILREEKCRAAQILSARGLKAAKLREEFARPGAYIEGGTLASDREEPEIRRTTAPEEFDLDQCIAQFLRAWEVKDANVIASLFYPEGSFVDGLGELWVGTGDIEAGVARQFAKFPQAPTKGKLEGVTYARDEHAVAVWIVDPDKKLLGGFGMRMTLCMVKANLGWGILAAHLTMIEPGRR
ncbi:MAG: SgcJ/EcaC family oxidoreductase [Candidatus Acidiferrales bacterium]